MKSIPQNAQELDFAFDVGHSSIGWAVLRGGKDRTDVEVLGCGVVTFRADDCLASSRRAYRRQRRHIRSTRQRIERMKRLLAHLKVMSRPELDRPGCAWPWMLAARVLASKTGKNEAAILSWAELWDVLRWYAHNRGYDGNRRWSAAEADAKDEDTEKVENARGLLKDLGTTSMAETVCAVSGIDPLGRKRSANVEPAKRFKARNAAFPREVVEGEVRRILEAHLGNLRGMDARLIKALMEDAGAIGFEGAKFPKRFQGGYLFGQLVPRFDNRIISKCPLSGEKVPTRNCKEFYDFRWGMQLANVRVSETREGGLRALTAEERRRIDAAARKLGRLTPKGFKELVRVESKCVRDNLETMLMHPDAEKALLIDPVQVAVTSGHAATLFGLLPSETQRVARVKLSRFKPVMLGWCYERAREKGGDFKGFDAELARMLEAAGTKKKKAEAALTREEVFGEVMQVKKVDGRAAFSKRLLAQAFAEVMKGLHPKEEMGCLFISEEIRRKELNQPIAEQTNNHLVRHRLLILERLAGDLVKEYAGGKKSAVGRMTIEVNRDLREMSGMSAQDKAKDLGKRLSNHKAVAAKLVEALSHQDEFKLTAGLIRKGRIAEDLGWTCPYTGQRYEPIDLVTRRVDKDHIVPRSVRPSDSLDSLAITFSQVNKMKGNRTAMKFIEECGGQVVEDLPNLMIRTPVQYKEAVARLDWKGAHDDDKRRKKKRKELLLLASYEEKEFVPRDLTVTSQLVRLGALALKRQFGEEARVVSQPGSVTGAVRKAWDVIGCLSAANPEVLEKDGTVKSKTDIRDITHLHHALDACVLGLSSRLIGTDGGIWELLVKRKWTAQEEKILSTLGIFGKGTEGRFEMKDLDKKIKAQIRERLAEKRVVQHIPARMDGMRAEQNVWRVVSAEDGEAELAQTNRGLDQKRVRKPATSEKTVKLVGVFPQGGNGKLAQIKGALVIAENFGVLLTETPKVIPFFKVWPTLQAARLGAKAKVLRNGALFKVMRGKYAGVWRVLSVAEKKSGIKLKFGSPDIVRRVENPINYVELGLKSLMRDGLEIVEKTYCGVSARNFERSCPTTSSASMARSVP